MLKMQDDMKILYKAAAAVIKKVKKEKGIKYTDFCYENEIPMSTYDDIMNAKTKASFYNIAKIVKALGLTFEDFGRLMDEKLPPDLFGAIK